MKVKCEEIKQSKIDLIRELNCVKAEREDGISQLMVKPGNKKDNRKK